MMKKYLLVAIVVFGFCSIANSQTVIEVKVPSSPSAVLDFVTGTAKGIILPAVETMPTTPPNGTFLFDKTAQQVKMYQNGSWVFLSGTGDNTKVAPYSGGTVDNGKQTIIGSRTTKVYNGTAFVDGAVDGVLVLESPTKALVLPHVSNPHLTIKSPLAGTMCYDTNRQALAVFDGKVWNYWK